MTLVALCPIAEIAVGSIRREKLPDGALVALSNVDGRIYATADACTRGAASLSEDGVLDGHIVECSWHYGSFDVTSGQACASPCTVAHRTYRVQVVDGIVNLELELAG